MLCFLILTQVVSLEVTKAGRQFHLEVLPGENVDELHCSVDVFSACLRYIKKGKLLWKERTAIPMQATLPASSMMESPMHGQEFQTLYQNRFRLIYRYVYSKVGNREEAEDLTSEIFLKAARGIDEERSRESMQQWLFYIARTTVADYWRGYYRHPKSSLEELVEVGWDVPDEESSFETNTAAADRVQRILQALPEQYREVLQCRFLLRLSIKATALKMGVSVANVKVLQYRALRRAATLE